MTKDPDPKASSFYPVTKKATQEPSQRPKTKSSPPYAKATGNAPEMSPSGTLVAKATQHTKI
jgi:hypothetical protein